MESTNIANQPKRISTWIPLVCILIVIAIFIRVHHDTLVNRDTRLYGNTSETPTALQNMLMKTPSQNQLPLLIRLANNHSAGLRYAVIDKLGSRYSFARVHGVIPVKALAAVELALQDDDTAVRQRAYEVLPEMEPQDRLLILFDGALSSNPWISEDCASLISQWMEAHKASPLIHNTIPGLIQMLHSKDQTVQQFAMTSLQIATGKPWRKSLLAPYSQREKMVDNWLAWWQKEKNSWKVPLDYLSFSPLPPNRTDPCPNFSVVELNGKITSLSQMKGHPFLLNFWGLNCGPCIQELPIFENLYQMDKRAGLRVVGIALEPETRSNEVANFCSQNGITYPQAIGFRSIQKNFGDITEVPVTFLVNSKGQIVRIWEGASPGPEPFSSAAKSLLTGK